MATTFDKENGIRVEKTARRAPFVSGTRNRLADISNITQQSRPFSQEDYTKQCIDQLQKDNMALMSIVSEKNKTIEIMRINLQKLQLQNLQLAQANKQIFAELNLDKDRLKVLQHELACKNGLLKARNMELVDTAKRKKCQKTGNEVGTTTCEKPEELSLANRNDNIPCCPNQKQCKDQSAGPFTTKQVQGKEKADKKRHSLRRQSSRFRGPKCSEDVFDPAYSICPSHNDDQMDGSGYASSVSLVKNDIKDANNARRNGTVEIQSEFIPSDLVQKEDKKGFCATMVLSTANRIQAEEIEDKKRHSSRRQSSRFKSRESEDLLDSNIKSPVCPLDIDDQANHNDCTSSVSLVKNYFEEGTKAPVNGMVEIRSCLNSSDSVQEEELFTAIGPCSPKQVKVKKKTDKKRLSSRRKSASLESREPECTEDASDLDDPNFRVCLLNNDERIAENIYPPSVSLVKNDLKKGNNSPRNGKVEIQNGSNPSESLILKEDIAGKDLRGRSSVGRPLRRAVERIHSYKEKPLKGKMRRSE